MAYGAHPSARLNALFRARPYQGADPETATFIFVGLDANFALDVEQSQDFEDLRTYLEDGVAYWRRTSLHHPFLSERYRGSGKRYHQQFAKIGFSADDAARVSFVELAHLPTHGSGSPQVHELNPTHLDRLEAWMTRGSARFVVMPKSVVRLLHNAGRMRWLDLGSSARFRSLPVIGRRGGALFLAPFHLSYRYAPMSERDQQLADLRSLISEGSNPAFQRTASPPLN